jgi:ribosome biogenesis GTPase / thiamine phosphate phosphatase
MIQVQLEELGWDGFFASQPCTGLPGRVASANRERFVVWTADGEMETGISGQLRRNESLWPAVGDWVVLRPGTAVIDQVFERKTVLSRKRPGRPIDEQVLAANVDVLFVVSGLDRDLNPRRIERYLVVAEQSGARPVIVLNKADLAEGQGIDLAELVAKLASWTASPVLALSAATGSGVDAIAGMIRAEETAALIGSSGAGKSTIVNRLLGEQRQPTSEVRKDDSRGRHTTTVRSMFMMPGGWLLIDMPGLREVQLWATSDGLNAGFEDIQERAQSCRFRNCTHTVEPGCAVLATNVDEDRLSNYHKMQRELDYLDRKADKRLMSESKARWKAIHKAMRKNLKTAW